MSWRVPHWAAEGRSDNYLPRQSQEAVVPDDPEALEPDPIDPAAHQALMAENAALKAKAAMLEAGVDLSTATGKMFLRAYDGEVDVEQIKLAAAEIPGALRTLEVVPEPGSDEPREEGEAGQFKERNDLTSDGAAGAEDPDPKTAAFGQLDEEIRKGVRLEDGIQATMRSLVHAANSGDQRVLAERNAG